jgi:DNA-binding MurR/RpiR family transcriptional regulator
VVKPKLHKSYRWMYRQYVVKKLTEEEIAELAGVNQATINRWLKKLELKD